MKYANFFREDLGNPSPPKIITLNERVVSGLIDFSFKQQIRYEGTENQIVVSDQRILLNPDVNAHMDSVIVKDHSLVPTTCGGCFGDMGGAPTYNYII